MEYNIGSFLKWRKIMASVSVFLVDGFETVECLAVVDLLRRAGTNVTTYSLTGHEYVTSAQNVIIKADEVFAGDSVGKAFDATMMFLPGGPGTAGYEKHHDFLGMLKEAADAGKWVTAICAAPSVLGHLGVLEGRRATCFPGFEHELHGAEVVNDKVVTDGNIITGKGMGASIDMGLEMVKCLCGEELARKLSISTQYVCE
jgi:4-methyl-5(b-hydroxyethyl)-thiazole monophosphate biosynthesis